MSASFIFFSALQHCVRTAASIRLDFGRFVLAAAQSCSALTAENLFLRKQLALFQERKARPRHAADATRWMMATLSHLFPWRGALVNVKPNTFIGWHRKGVPAVLAMEVQTDGTTTPPQGASTVDPKNGHRESDLG